MSETRFNAPPGWPTPPRGWQPDPNWRPDPSWPPAPQGWQWWVADAQAYGVFPPVPAAPFPQEAWPGARPAVWAPPNQAAAWPSQPLTALRSNASRNWLTVGIVLVPFVVAGVLGVLVGAAVGSRTYSTDAAFEEAIANASSALYWLVVICFLIAYAVAARKVSYRWFDTFFLLIPIYSIVWQFKIAHRLAYLPHRDWAPRPEEVRPSLATVPGWPTR
jgi:hypothetical protein